MHPPDDVAAEPASDFLEAVISSLPSGVITTDYRGRISHVNDAATVILGRPREALVGAELGSLRAELEVMRWPADKGEVLLTASGRPGELQFDGARVLGFSSREVLNGAGAPRGTAISFSDITDERVRAREEEHGRRLADIGRVVANIAHEIRNPLFALGSLAQVLASEPAIAADRDHHELVDKMIQEARRIARLVDDLLAFGRERPLEKRHADVVDLVTTLVADLQRGLALVETGAMPVPIRVHVAARVRADPVWDVDQEALRRVVGNLVRNAHEAVRGRLDRDPHDGIDVRLARGSDWLEIAVEDQGVGIAEDKLPRVREAFYTTRHGGTGLGLAICDRIVRQHHGELRLSSQLGAGTTVTVRLPP